MVSILFQYRNDSEGIFSQKIRLAETVFDKSKTGLASYYVRLFRQSFFARPLQATKKDNVCIYYTKSGAICI